MRILYCLDFYENKYVTNISEIWFYSSDQSMYKGRICFIDINGYSYKSEIITQASAIIYLHKLVENGYLNLENVVFEIDEEE